MVSAQDIFYMQRALDLARRGTALASPNPLVGCVIVREDRIVGEGFHRYDQRDHAEIVALKIAGKKAGGATLYVNLEPCNHAGRTGPCTEAILAAGVRRVVAAMPDPNPATCRRGFARLRRAGLEVVTNVQEEEAQRLNEAFDWWIRKKKPFVTLKSALTADAQLALLGARNHRARRWITSAESRAEVQRMRHASDALLTGIGTVLADDPLLTDRTGAPRRRPLLRVVLDASLRLSLRSRIARSVDRDVLLFTAAPLDSAKARKLSALGVDIVQARAHRGHIDLEAVLIELGRRDILSVLLESGPTLNGTMLSAGLVQKAVMFYSPAVAGKKTVPFAHMEDDNRLGFENPRVRRFGPDTAIESSIVFRR